MTELIKDYKDMTKDELLESYKGNLEEYVLWVSKDFLLDEDWLEEIEYMTFIRSQLHQIIEILDKRGISVDIKLLHNQDIKWQEWAINHTDLHFEIEHKRDGIPKIYWWDWIDHLEDLSPEERSTI
jgi:hypothetical protein